jgi:lysine 6-dehydrogenase
VKILVVGAGMMARAVVHDLVRAEDVEEVRVIDRSAAPLRTLREATAGRKLRTSRADAGDRAAMADLMRPCAVAVSCVPYFYNLVLTRAAIAARTHFCDLGGNNEVVARQLALDDRARAAGVRVVPDCGLAPGLVGIVAADGVRRLDETRAVHLRVGGLPQHPKPPLDYGLIFSANGLINEYVEPCLVLRDGEAATVPALYDLEDLEFPPFGRLEAFNTSGGSSTLPQTFRGRVEALDYKTIRYPGHCARIRLLFDLGLADSRPLRFPGGRVSPREVLTRLLEDRLEHLTEDVVLLRATVEGTRAGEEITICYELVDYADPRTGLTAMMRTTGFPAAVAALTLARDGVDWHGARPGELAFDPALYLAELPARGLDLRTTEQPSGHRHFSS